METINTIEFPSQEEDTSFNVEDHQYEANTMSEPETQEEPSQEEVEEEQSAQESDSEDGCEMEQVPVGVENIVCNRGNKKLEGQVLVFTNPETDCFGLKNNFKREDLIIFIFNYFFKPFPLSRPNKHQ